MPTVTRSPVNLAWTDYTPVPSLVDPADGEAVDAYTAFTYNITSPPHTNSGGGFQIAEPLVITLAPVAQVRTGAAQTAGLLSHEQFHYDVGFVCARALARHLLRLRGATTAQLNTAANSAVNLHLITRAGLLQRRYDIDTRHGTVAKYQTIWKDRMAKCLADANATQLGGFFL